MLRKHGQMMLSVLFASDMVVLVISWLLAYYLRFYGGIYPVEKGTPPLGVYLQLIPFVVVIWAVVLRYIGLYIPRRGHSLVYELRDILKATTVSTIILIMVTFFHREHSYSRLVMVLFWGINSGLLLISRSVIREVLHTLRRRHINLRHILIVGAGEMGTRLLEKMQDNAWAGFKVVGFLDNEVPLETRIKGVPLLGSIQDVKRVLREHAVDQVYVALPMHAYAELEQLLHSLGDETPDVKLVPDLLQFMALNAGVEDLDGIPVVNLSESPMYGWNRIVKRLADMVFSILILTATAPLFGVIALLIKLGSPGPVFYRQERMSIGGEVFTMLKFRTMRMEAEEETGPVWATPKDPRRTWIGALLRRTSLDELPQFINVLKGGMSIVGPRPERPVFIDDFRRSVPRYMLRHKMKAGITGWAQVNGWRGRTSVEKRIEYDLYYIENWSLAFDIKIMWLTLWRGMINRNAY